MLFGVVHLVIAPVLLPPNAVSAATTEPWAAGAARSAELDAGIEQKDLILDVSPDGRPLSVAFRFAERLEHSSLQWLVWEEGGWARFLPPDVGQSVTLPAGSFLF